MLEAPRRLCGSYTVDEVKPLVAPHMTDTFHPQTVPAYGASTLFERLREYDDHYMYRETALNPTNRRNEPADWEHDIVTTLRNHPEKKEIRATRSTPSGDMMYIAAPIKITKASCLDCHGDPADAPPRSSPPMATRPASAGRWTKSSAPRSSRCPPRTPRRTNKIFMTLMGVLVGCAIVVIAIVHFLLCASWSANRSKTDHPLRHRQPGRLLGRGSGHQWSGEKSPRSAPRSRA